MLTLTGKDIPKELKRLPQPPFSINIIGDSLTKLLKRPRLAIVGTRKLTPYGRGVTYELAYKLAKKGVVIISGLALGADSVAHQAAIDASGQTIAVLPSGPDRIYPSNHVNLAKQIVATGGLLITEYEGNYRPHGYDFLKRNRLVAALSEGLLVTEAAARSGTLNTASHALELGLPIFAVPGNITNPLSEGCNNLLKAGATPTTSIEDIINTLKWADMAPEMREVIADNPEEQIVIDLLRSGLSDGSELLLRSQLEARLFNQTLTMLEISGRVRPIGANHWSL